MHCEEGARKYGERNIDLGCPQHALISSGFRHLAKYTMGHTDEDHLRAAFWNIAWALEQELVKPEMQDIPACMQANTNKTIKEWQKINENARKRTKVNISALKCTFVYETSVLYIECESSFFSCFFPFATRGLTSPGILFDYERGPRCCGKSYR